MKLNLLIIPMVMVASISAKASPERCEFENVSGDLFEFSQPLPILMRHDTVDITESGKYPFWYEEANTNSPIAVDSYFGRLAKIQSKSPVKRVFENTFKDVREKRFVSYYSAIADNCEQIYVRVVENEFPQYFSEEIDFVSHKFDFLEQERWIGITMIDNFKNLESKKISHVTVRPEGDGRVFFFDEVGSSFKPLERYETLEVIDAKRAPIYLKGELLSNYGIKVKYQGNEGYINSDYRYIFNGNPLLDVDSEFINPISKGKLSFGMSKGDVLLSWGIPSSTTNFPVYQTDQGYQVDYQNNMNGEDHKKIGDISHWHFDHIDIPIIFSMRGVLEESKQRFSRFDPMGLPDFIME